MAHRQRAIGVTAVCIGLAIASCAYQPHPATSLAIQKDVVQPTVLTPPAGQEGKKLSAEGGDTDCVLTTGDIHLWCKWIARYY